MTSEDRSKITQIRGHSTSKQGSGLFPSAGSLPFVAPWGSLVVLLVQV